jgi:CarD family transcriptional regulator
MKVRRSLGSGKKYYSIELLSQPSTLVMVPVQSAENIGLRRSISKSRLNQVWKVLSDVPNALPSDHEERYALIKQKLRGGDVLQVAEAVRDMASRQEQKRSLTEQGKRLYEEGMLLLAGEVAIVLGSDLTAAQAKIAALLEENVTQ